MSRVMQNMRDVLNECIHVHVSTSFIAIYARKITFQLLGHEHLSFHNGGDEHGIVTPAGDLKVILIQPLKTWHALSLSTNRTYCVRIASRFDAYTI